MDTPSDREWGTDTLTATYKRDTPGQHEGAFDLTMPINQVAEEDDDCGCDDDEDDSVVEDLRAWFGKGKEGGAGGGGWDRYNTNGERIGKCGDAEDRGGDGEGKPKCLSKEKAAQLRAKGGKQAIANAVKRKKEDDPVTNRKGTGNAPRPVSNRIDEENTPTDPTLWSKAKSLAKSKFDVYPSAYANGWAAKWYKEHGGSWKTVKEERLTELTDRPLPWRMTYSMPDFLEAQFSAPNSHEVYKVHLTATKKLPTPPRRPGVPFVPIPPVVSEWEFGFGRYGSSEWGSEGTDAIVGGTGAEIAILSTVVAILKTFFQIARPNMVYYRAKEPSRARLYSRFIQRVASLIPGYVGKEVRPKEYEIRPAHAVKEHIVKVNGKWRLMSKTSGKNLGTYDTKAGAEKREREVQYFKHEATMSDVPSFKEHLRDFSGDTIEIKPPMPADQVNEVHPPGMEDWIKSNKARFTKQYGAEKGTQVLYATAWDMYHKGKRS